MFESMPVVVYAELHCRNPASFCSDFYVIGDENGDRGDYVATDSFDACGE
jgi:hypothetical protein